MSHIRRLVITLLLVYMLIPFVGNRTLADTKPSVLIKDEAEYWEFVENTELPEDFVYYSDDWSVLGTFAGITSYSSGYLSYWYYLTGKNSIEIRFVVHNRISQLSTIEVPSESNLLFNSDETATWVYCQVGKIQYYYGDGKLSYIRWFEQRESEIKEFILEADFDKYPQEERDLCSLLLSSDTAMEGQEQLFDLLGIKNPCIPELKPPTDVSTDTTTTDAIPSNGENASFPWLWLALPVGAVVIAGGAAFVLLRKKRKSSPTP